MKCYSIYWLCCIALLSLLVPLHAYYHPYPPNSGPYRLPSVDDLSAPTSTISITQPEALLGNVVFSIASRGGQLFSAPSPYLLTKRILIPNSHDDERACEPLLLAHTDDGESLEDAILLLKRGGGCSFAAKIQHAAAIPTHPNSTEYVHVLGVIIYGCDPLDGCFDGLELMSAVDDYTLPAVYVASADGALLAGHIKSRRTEYDNIVALNGSVPAICRNITTQTEATTYGCPSPLLYGSLVATEGLVDPLEREALVTLANAWTMDMSLSYLKPWSSLIENPTSDPCIDRLTGIYCEAGHIISIELTTHGVEGEFPADTIKKLTKLRFLILLGNSVSGALPLDLCHLSHLELLQLDGNKFSSIPDCIGGGTYDIAKNGVPAGIYEGMQRLMIFAASDNLLSNFPSTLGNLHETLLILALYRNQMIGQLYEEVFNLKYLIKLELYSNQLSFDFATASSSSNFRLMTQLQSLLLKDLLLIGILPIDIFDGLNLLAQIDISNNKLEGDLPSLLDCASLQVLSFSYNSFIGTLPDWSHLTKLTILHLEHNQLGEGTNMETLSYISSLQYAYLSYNNISGSNPDDAGESLWYMMNNALIELYLDHNKIKGGWTPQGWYIDTLRTLNVAYNEITNLPEDLWLFKTSNIDFSFNLLSSVFPTGSPSIQDDPIAKRPAVRRFNVQGNPNLQVWPLPAWLSQSSDPHVPQVLSSGGLYQCKALKSVSELLEISVDASFTQYHGCSCVRGTFGIPPLCSFLPQSASLFPYSPAVCDEVGPHFADLVAQTEAASGNSSVQLASKRKTFHSMDSSLHPFHTLSASTVPYDPYPTSFSDEWYGSNRYTSGMATRWTLDLRNVRLSSPGPLSSSSELVLLDSPYNLTASIYFPAMVRVVTVHLHIDKTTFTSDCTLSVYTGPSTLTGTRVSSLSGADHSTVNSLKSSSAWTSTTQYQNKYANRLAELNDPVVWEVPIYAAQATLDFVSRSSSGLHFIATYSYEFQCPAGKEVPEGYEERFNNDPSTLSCVEPTLGSSTTTLILLVSIGGALALFAFIWLMYERFQRARLKNKMRLHNSGSLGLHSRTQSRGNSASSLDQGWNEDEVEEDMIYTQEEMEEESGKIKEKLKTDEYRSLIKEMTFDLLTLVSSIISSILNWIVVGEYLADDATNLSTIGVLYICTVIIATFAVGANLISQFFILRDVYTQMQALNSAMVLHTSNLSSVALVHPNMMSIMSADLESLRKVLAQLARKQQRYGILIISLTLDSIPFAVLNLIVLYTGESLSSRSGITIQVALLVAFALIGAKLQMLREYPQHQLLYNSAKLRLYQLRLEQISGVHKDTELGKGRNETGSLGGGAARAASSSGGVPGVLRQDSALARIQANKAKGGNSSSISPPPNTIHDGETIASPSRMARHSQQAIDESELEMEMTSL